MTAARPAQHLTDGRWRIRLDGFPDVTTDDMTLEDVELAEKVCGLPWVLLNPLASAKEAKALLTVLLVRSGIPEDEALKAASKTPLPKLARAFSFELADRRSTSVLDGGGEPDPPPPAPTSAGG